MTDNHELLDRADDLLGFRPDVPDDGDEGFELVADLASALRASDRDLATARDAVQRIKEAAAALDDECAHIRAEGLLRPSLETLLDVVKLASVVSPPTSGQDRSTVSDGT